MDGTEARELEIQLLCKGVLEIGVIWEYPLNGRDYVLCPFCYTREELPPETIEMGELEHDPNCEWLIARSLSTGFEDAPK